MLLQDQGTARLDSAKTNRRKRTDGLLFRTSAPSIEDIRRKEPGCRAGPKPAGRPSAEGGSSLPPPDTTDPADKIFTCNQAAKRLGIPLGSLRRLVRDGTLWAVRMSDGELGLRESEVQRYIDRFEKPAQKGE